MVQASLLHSPKSPVSSSSSLLNQPPLASICRLGRVVWEVGPTKFVYKEDWFPQGGWISRSFGWVCCQVR